MNKILISILLVALVAFQLSSANFEAKYAEFKRTPVSLREEWFHGLHDFVTNPDKVVGYFNVLGELMTVASNEQGDAGKEWFEALKDKRCKYHDANTRHLNEQYKERPANCPPKV